MRPGIEKLIRRLQLGFYMVHVSETGTACAVAVSRPERAAFEPIWGESAHMGRHPKDWEPGSYLIRVDGKGHANEVVGMNAAESRAFISDVLGCCRCTWSTSDC